MTRQSFVFNYTGRFRSDLKESHKATASTEVMDKLSKELNDPKK